MGTDPSTEFFGNLLVGDRRDFLKVLRLTPLLILLSACQHHPSTREPSFRVVVAARNLPAGIVLQAADVKTIEVSIDHPALAFGNAGLTNDSTRVIGHTTKVAISEGLTISIHQVEP